METVQLTASTNADMLEHARAGAAEGLWIRAERQNAGRGRLGRTWESPVGNLFASTLVRLRADDPPASTLAFVTALAVYDTVAPYLTGNPPQLKWPNDVLVGGKKLCGMLLERCEDAVIVGIGINIAAAPDIPGREVTCLHDAGAPKSLDATIVVGELAEKFQHIYAEWRDKPISYTLDKWQDKAHKTGTEIKISREGANHLTGTFIGIDVNGSLKIRTESGAVQVIHAGDVEIVRNIEE
nr:biotin--[acetyl-CoA-carboxylase] ligase [Sphingorhabdus sp. Alg239-R122]